MRQFTYRIQGELPMRFGPAGLLVSLCKRRPDTKATIQMDSRIADISRPMKLAAMICVGMTSLPLPARAIPGLN